MKKDISSELYARARKVMPGGVNSPVRAFNAVGGEPLFIKSGKGCRVTDVDGNEFIDFMCGFGSQILGYGYESVLKAGIDRMTDGDLLTTPSPVMVELAERVVARIRGMEWTVFTKNGTDATTLAVTLARIETDKPVILMATGAYHGAANWCSSNEYPILDDRRDIVL